MGWLRVTHAFTNAEKQARWRERHVWKRYAVQQVSKVLLREQGTDQTIKELANALRGVLNLSSIAALRRALKPTTMKEDLAAQTETFRLWQALWLREHPGKTAKDYRRLINTDVEKWQRAKAEAYNAAERLPIGVSSPKKATSPKAGATWATTNRWFALKRGALDLLDATR